MLNIDWGGGGVLIIIYPHTGKGANHDKIKYLYFIYLV